MLSVAATAARFLGGAEDQLALDDLVGGRSWFWVIWWVGGAEDHLTLNDLVGVKAHPALFSLGDLLGD